MINLKMDRFENLKMIGQEMIRFVDGCMLHATSYGLSERYAQLAPSSLQPEAILISKFYILNS
jgi:hypothetical protein